MEARFIYRNRLDARFYDASTGEMRGGADKVIVYINGVLCAMDREAKITIPISRWKLAEIGLACFLAALKGKGAASRSIEPVALPLPSPEALLEPPAETIPNRLEFDRQESSESQWERLIRELRDLSR
jgi:type IV secretory pathway TrbD component